MNVLRSTGDGRSGGGGNLHSLGRARTSVICHPRSRSRASRHAVLNMSERERAKNLVNVNRSEDIQTNAKIIQSKTTSMQICNSCLQHFIEFKIVK